MNNNGFWYLQRKLQLWPENFFLYIGSFFAVIIIKTNFANCDTFGMIWSPFYTIKPIIRTSISSFRMNSRRKIYKFEGFRKRFWCFDWRNRKQLRTGRQLFRSFSCSKGTKTSAAALCQPWLLLQCTAWSGWYWAFLPNDLGRQKAASSSRREVSYFHACIHAHS